MVETLSGRVLFANGVPARDVRIRVFDQDEPGKQDDDLTTGEGISDNNGRFTVSFERARFQDYNTIRTTEPRNPPWDWTLVMRTRRVPEITDIYLPYLRFRYMHAGRMRIHIAYVIPFITEFRLPENFFADGSVEAVCGRLQICQQLHGIPGTSFRPNPARSAGGFGRLWVMWRYVLRSG